MRMKEKDQKENLKSQKVAKPIQGKVQRTNERKEKVIMTLMMTMMKMMIMTQMKMSLILTENQRTEKAKILKIAIKVDQKRRAKTKGNMEVRTMMK